MLRAIDLADSTLTELIGERRYVEACDFINSLDPRALRTRSRSDLSHIYFIHAKCLYHLGEYAKAAVKLKVSIKLSRPLNDRSFYARQKYTLGRIYEKTGRLDLALEEYNESYAFYRSVGDLASMLAPLETMANVHFQKGNYGQARQLNEDILRRARTGGFVEDVRISTFNLCRVLLLTGEFERIQSLLESVSPDTDEAVVRARIDNLTGMTLVWLLDHRAAETSLNRALEFYVSAGLKRDEVVCLEYLGLNEYFQGNYTAARLRFDQILAMPELTASAVAQTLRMLTETQIALGDFDEAETTAARAEEAITKIGEQTELGALYRARAILCEHGCDHSKTREYFDKSIDLLHRLGARYELALSHFACGQSQCCSGELRLDHLQKSKSLFVEMDVPKRVAQVEQVIGELSRVSAKPHSKRNHKNPGESSITDPDIVTENPEMKRILADAFKLANTDYRILITGETGTGKDLLAERIHCLSARKAGPFVNENMSRLPRELAESELFGYEKGSHSGAHTERVGLIESADGGTFCLNEIAELRLDLQAKLLQVIEQRKLRRVGGASLHAIDVRFIAMTNADLDGRVASGLFRPDLRQRLTQGQLHLPPLRERKGDLPLLTQFFLRKLGFGDYDLDQTTRIVENCGLDLCLWTGNVRELQSVLEEAVALTGKGSLTELLGRLKLKMQRPSNGHSADSERAKLIEALKRHGGNQSKAARELNLARTTFRHLLKKHGLD